jgi:predicted secreted protein
MDNWVTGGMVYVIVWWLVFFMVLPWGIRPVDPDDVAKGHAESAPKKPRILLKMAITTVIAAILWAGGYWLAGSGLISFRPPSGG